MRVLTPALLRAPNGKTWLEKQAGFALVLCLLVLTIVVVVTVQFQASGRVEQRVAQAQASDETLGLAARGAVYHCMALMVADQAGELTVGEYELQDVDTLAEPFMDPEATDARNINGSSGTESINSDPFGTNTAVSSPPVTIEYTVEDLQGRFNLNWLRVENEGFRTHAAAALKRLVALLGHPEEFGETLVEFVQGEGETDTTTNTNSTSSTSTNSTGTEDEVPPREMLSLNELFDIEDENIVQILTGKDENNEPLEDVKPLLDYLTVWDTPGLNVNTSLPEVFAAWLPNTDKQRPQPRQFSTQRRIQATKELIMRRLHVEGDENFEITAEDSTTTETEETEDTTNTDTTTDTTETENAGSDWIGEAPLKNLRDVAKVQSLRFVFSSTAGQAPRGNTSAGTGATTATADAGFQNWYDVLKFKSQLYRIKVTATQGDITKFFHAIIFRGDSSEENQRPSVVLEWREVEE